MNTERLQHATNVATRWIVIGPFLLWLVWELALVYMRERLGMNVRLVSQEARSLAYRGLPSLAYFVTGLAIHFFVNWPRPTWDGHIASALGVMWWAVGAVYLVTDALVPASHIWVRWPPFVALLGGALAFFAFPQHSLWNPWGAR